MGITLILLWCVWMKDLQTEFGHDRIFNPVKIKFLVWMRQKENFQNSQMNLDGIWGFQILLTNLSLSSFKFKPHTPLTNPPNFHPHPQTTIPKPTIPYWLSTSWGCLSMSFTWVTVLGSCRCRGSILMVVIVDSIDPACGSNQVNEGCHGYGDDLNEFGMIRDNLAFWSESSTVTGFVLFFSWTLESPMPAWRLFELAHPSPFLNLEDPLS